MRLGRVAVVACFALLAVHLTFGLGGRPLDGLVDRWLSDGLEVVAALACLIRAAGTRNERGAWAALGLGVLSFALGDVCFDFVYGGNPPTPSVADVFYLGFYPGAYTALALLVRSRISSFGRSLWLDGVIAALAACAVSAAIVLEVVIETTTGKTSMVVTDLAYPVADLVLLALVVFVFAITGWRPGRAWAFVGGAFATITVADSIFLYLSATGVYVEGSWLDLLWPASMLLLAAAAWQSVEREHSVDLEGRFLAATPLVCGVVALAVLVDGRFQHHDLAADAFAAGAILTVFIRTGLSFLDNSGLLEHTRAQSLTDYLTGLGNRRRLMVELERATRSGEAVLLAIFDLNGFKRYNDTYGHLSGDAMLARIAGKLELAVAPAGGHAYRLGGDEFCILVPVPADGGDALLEAAVVALSEDGEGFEVATEYGAVVLPGEAGDPTAALRLADERLYARKHSLYRGEGEAHEVLLRALSEREPGLRDHMRGVAELSATVGLRLGVSGEALKQLLLAAELHDVGKLAIPDAVLAKPGALNAEEWAFVRQHTLIGQRILAGAPAMREVGKIVRATHERWDGSGYADGLAGEAIPLAARIIAVCDAFSAMTSDRPYRQAVAVATALDELRRCAGTQFDPKVVKEFCRLHDHVIASRSERLVAITSSA
jgi:diguanylate cyclase (GGDEF)-like protein